MTPQVGDKSAPQLSAPPAHPPRPAPISSISLSNWMYDASFVGNDQFLFPTWQKYLYPRIPPPKEQYNRDDRRPLSQPPKSLPPKKVNFPFSMLRCLPEGSSLPDQILSPPPTHLISLVLFGDSALGDDFAGVHLPRSDVRDFIALRESTLETEEKRKGQINMSKCFGHINTLKMQVASSTVNSIPTGL